MGFLDKLKPLPRWKHQDPSVRLEAVRELDDPMELAGLAEHDQDARVRRAAVAKTDDVATLGRVAAGDPDTEARDRAGDRLFAVASATGTDVDVVRALVATEALTDARRLSTLAKSGADESVCAAALARTTDDRALSSIARHATHEAIARVALARLTSPDDLVEVAEHGGHKDVALGAFDRLVASSPAPDLALLRAIEAKSEQKAVSKRARALIQDLEDAEAARRQAEEEHRRQQVALCESVEQLSTLAADVTLLRTELARLTESWETLGANDAAALERFALGVTEAQATIARRERETEEAAERARLRAEAIATRDALCTRVETLDGDDALEQLVPIEEEWRSLLPLIGNGPEADRLAGRFAQAVAACRTRHEMRAVLAGTGEKLAGLVAEAEGLLSQDDQAAARWPALSRDARGLASLLAGGGRPAVDLQARLDAVDQAFAARETARREAAAKAQHDVVARLHRLAERARRAAEADTITLKEGDRLMRDLGTGLEDAGRAEGSREISDAVGLLRKLQEQVAPRVRELRDMDEWRRFANAQRQEQLIAMAEAIVASLKSDTEAGRDSDLAATARALRELHAKWQEVADAPRQSAQRLWDRFRFATDFIRDRCEKYFAAMRAEKGANLEKKTALVQEAEALGQSSDWGKATARFQAMQTEWQAVGPIPREPAQELAHRFRAACNAFFSRRREDLADRKKAWSENLARKEALCVRAEALVESTEWESAAAEMKRLQIEWKTVGPVRRNKSETIWNRFRAAADAFFERFHNRHQITMATKLAEREALVVDLEAVGAAEGEAAEGLLDRVQTLRTTWNRGVPIPAAEMKPLVDRWQAAFAGVLAKWPAAFQNTEFDPALVIQRMEKLIAKVEALLADVREPVKGQSQAEILAAKLRSALASNAMGGRASEEGRWRAAADAVRDAQSAWQRLTPLAGSDTHALETRFREACRRVNEHARRHTGQTGQAGPARRPNAPKAAAM